MTKTSAKFTFTDSDGDEFVVTNVKANVIDGFITCTVSMNGRAKVDVLEWLNQDNSVEFIDSHMRVHNAQEFGCEAINTIQDHLQRWMDEQKQAIAA